MTHNEKIFRDMLKLSLLYASSKRGAWESYPIIAQCWAELESCSQRLDAAVEDQYQNEASSQAAGKHALLSQLGQGCYKLSRKLALFAKRSGSASLQASTSDNESAYTYNSEEAVLQLCAKQIALGRQQLEALQAYGLSVQELELLEGQLATARALPVSVQASVNEKKQSTAELKQCIAEARILLDQLDDAFEGMLDDQHFLAGWFSVRRIKGRHRAKKNDDLLAVHESELQH